MTTIPALIDPNRVFVVTYTVHGPDCDGCETAAKSGAIYARATGSVGSNYSDGPHLAMVRRASTL